MQYDDIIKALKKNPPVPASPGQITGRIMSGIESNITRRPRVISLRVSSRQWQVLNGVRTLLAAAAVFLIGFFIMQQREISNRLANLETSVSAEQQPAVAGNEQARLQQISGIFQNSVATDSLQEMLRINRRSLDFMLSRISELESENLTIREKLQQYYIDSTKIKNQNDNEN